MATPEEKGEVVLDRKCRDGEEKASWGQRASSPMDGRPGDGQGLSGEVGFTEQKSSMLYPRTQRSEIATVELRQDGGNAAQATGQSKGRWEDCLLAPRGHRKRRLVHCHQRRARLLQGSSSPGLSPVLTLEELMVAEFLSDLPGPQH